MLGAGVSHTAGLPLAQVLLGVVAEKSLTDAERSELLLFLEYLMPTFSTDDLNYPDVEEFLTLLDVAESYSRSAPGKLEFPRRRLSKLRRIFLNRLSEYLWSGHKNLAKDHPLRLFGVALNPGDVIITFNYDIIAEYCISQREGDLSWDYSPTREQICLLKPHGSIDWFYSDEVEADGKDFSELLTDLTQYSGWDFVPAIRGKMPVIVPPVASKLIESRDLQQIWNWVTDTLVEADEIYILGYSLPPADRLTRFVLRQCILTRNKVPPPCIVNPSGHLRSRFQEWISSDVRFVQQRFERWATVFHREEMLRRAEAEAS